MPDLPTDWTALCAFVFLLGVRHGLDADHLAAIDALARLGLRHGERRSRLAGVLFSLGHGAVVVGIALLVALLGARWSAPAWAEAFGSAVSIGVLAGLGIVNLLSVRQSDPQAHLPPVGLRGRLVERLVGRFGGARGAMAVAGIGALFALSFDTLSQAALFAALSVQHGGIDHALALGGLFTLGMLASDGLNGWWIARLVERSDRLALRASRLMTVAVAAASLLVAALGVAKLASTRLEGWADAHGLAIGLAVIVLVAAGYLAACRLADPARAPA